MLILVSICKQNYSKKKQEKKTKLLGIIKAGGYHKLNQSAL